MELTKEQKLFQTVVQKAWEDAAFKQELILLVVAILVSFMFDISRIEQMMLILAIVFIIFTEVINTAIEATIDRVGLEIHPLSCLAKDLGSAAVMLSMAIAATIWVVVLWP